MGLRFPRCMGPEQSLCAGEYTVNTESRRPVLMCPCCGERFELPRHCMTDHEGRVTPAIKCISLACPFFEFCTLESIWEGP